MEKKVKEQEKEQEERQEIMPCFEIFELLKKHPILFFDGECGLCHRAVQSIYKRDREKKIYFAPILGATAKKVLKEEHFGLNSLILVENEKEKLCYFWRSAAIFRLLYHLYPQGKIKGILIRKALNLLSLLSPLFNPLYRIIASYRQFFSRLFFSRHFLSHFGSKEPLPKADCPLTGCAIDGIERLLP